MNDVAFALDSAVDTEPAGAEHDMAIFLEGLYPDHEIGDPGLILDGDEHQTLRRARSLLNKGESCGLERRPRPFAL